MAATGGSAASSDPAAAGAVTAPPATLPSWYLWFVTVAIVGVVSFGLIGVALAVAGHFSAPTLFPAGLIGTGLGVAAARPRRRDFGPADPGAQSAAGAMVISAVALAVWNTLLDGHHVLVDIDSGVNTVAAKWLAMHGNLVVPAGQPWHGVGTQLSWASPAMYRDGSNLNFQFTHFLPALMAGADLLGSDRFMFAVLPALGSLGLCAIYAVACRLSGRPWLAYAAVLGLGLSVPQLWTSRDPFSEVSTQTVFWGGMLILAEALRRHRRPMALVGGLALGATFSTRIDGLIYLVPLPALAGLAMAAARHNGRLTRSLVTLLAAGVGAGVAAAVATTDLLLRADGYYHDLAGQVHSLSRALMVCVLIGVVAAALPVRWWSRLAAVPLRDRIAVAAGALVTIILLLAWGVRPDWWQRMPVALVNPTVPPRQLVEGYPKDPTRTYGEQSLRWMEWYLGPVLLVAAVLGLGLLTVRLLRRPEPLLVLVLVVAGGCAALYLWNPQITPTQIYVMRRYVPTTMPLLAIAAAVGLAAVARLAARALPAGLGSPGSPGGTWPRGGNGRSSWGFGPARVERAVVAVAAVAALAFPVGMVLPVAKLHVQAGYQAVIDATCRQVGPHGAVLLAGSDLGETIPQTLRSWCNVPVVWTAKPTPQLVAAAARAMDAQGRTLWVLASTPNALRGLGSGAPRLVRSVTNSRQLEWTLTRPPAGYINQRFTVYGVPAAHGA